VPELRPADVDDVASLLGVFEASVDDLAARTGRLAPPRSPAFVELHMRHFLAGDARSCFVAEELGRVVAFAMLHVRGGSAFLAFLFVLPGFQGRALGRSLVAACREGAGRPRRTATCAEADQPVSTGLYASIGLAPRLPLYLLRGRPNMDALPPLPAGGRARPLQATDATEVAWLDRELLGYARAADHAFFAQTGRRGWLVEDASGIVAYGYAHRSGRIGPVAVADEHLLPGVIGLLVREVPVADGRQVVVAGTSSLLPVLLGARMRIDGAPAMYCADHPGPLFGRYLPSNFALL
jgi:GNAT superfamily N-acetyltransferase